MKIIFLILIILAINTINSRLYDHEEKFTKIQELNPDKAPVVGLKAIVLKSVLLEREKAAVPSALRRIMSIKIPNVEGETSVPVIGGIQYWLSDIQITDLKIEDVELETKEPW
jgi:hypothetical protein